jgi:hypothetical protein
MTDVYDVTPAWNFIHPNAKRRKITAEGQPCRHCKAPVRKNERIEAPTKRNPSGYYFAWWFVCTNSRCRALYMVEAAKRWFDTPTPAVTAAVCSDPSQPFTHGPGTGDDPDGVPWHNSREEMLAAEAKARTSTAGH